MKVVYNGENDIEFKNAISKTLQEICSKDKDIVYLDADLASCINMAKWLEEHPEQAVNCGIAEANMVGIAAGMSAVGFKPVIHSFGPFVSRRCFDQIFLSGGYAGNSITVIGTDPGVCAAFNGGTHMPFEDMALYRTIPGAYVFDVTDTVVFSSVLEQCINLTGIKYIRVGRKSYKKMYATGSKAEIGKGNLIKENGNDAVIIACGIMVAKAMEAADILMKEGIRVSVIDMYTVKPLDEELLIKYAVQTGAVVTAENHNKIGGLYSAVTEAISRRYPVPVEYVAVEDLFGEVGPQEYLEKKFGLTAEHITEKVKIAMQRKAERFSQEVENE